MNDLAKILHSQAQALGAKLAKLNHQEQEIRCFQEQLEANTHCHRIAGPHGVTVEFRDNEEKWLRWVSAKRKDCNMQLARLNAQKEVVLHDFRKAFAKAKAFENLKTQAHNDHRKQMAVKEHSDQLQCSLMLRTK
ncbi:hypothetical protein [Shimia sp. SDUM112013]|uniref:hypothetical protein n=1 Tax=Shimia sp. SDUM112013 TaxID=3136160 RepID=UPI0032EC0D62